MDAESMLSFIANAPDDPFDLFKEIINDAKANSNVSTIMMNIATRNNEFGIANRTVVYRGLIDSDIVFVTEKNSMKYKEIMEDPRVAVTFLFHYVKNDLSVTQQIKIHGKAVELAMDQLQKLWEEEPVYAKIRSHICECGKPIHWEALKAKHDDILRKYKNGEEKLAQTSSYTAFRIKADVVDFYQDGDRHVIPAHVIYKNKGASWTKDTSYP